MRPPRFEPGTFSSVVRCSIQLSYGRVKNLISKINAVSLRCCANCPSRLRLARDLSRELCSLSKPRAHENIKRKRVESIAKSCFPVQGQIGARAPAWCIRKCVLLEIAEIGEKGYEIYSCHQQEKGSRYPHGFSPFRSATSYKTLATC